MKRSEEKNRKFAGTLIHKLDPSFKQRWELYDSILKRMIGPAARWLDAGCESNIAIEEFPCALNVGMDVYRHPEVLHSPPNHFLLGALDCLPFRDEGFTLVTLYTVVEHLINPETVFGEICRALSVPMVMYSFIRPISIHR